MKLIFRVFGDILGLMLFSVLIPIVLFVSFIDWVDKKMCEV